MQRATTSGRRRPVLAALAGMTVLALAAACAPSPHAVGQASVPSTASIGATAAPAPITYRTAVPTDSGVAASSGGSGDTGSTPPRSDDRAGAGSSSGDASSAPSDSADPATSRTGGNPTAATGSPSTGTSPSTPPRPAATSIAAPSSAVSATYGEKVTLTFRVTSAGAPVTGAATTVSYRDHSRTVTADAQGRASTALGGLPVGTTAVQLRYLGDATHRAAAATVSVTVDRRPTEISSLTVAGATVTVNQTVTVDLGQDVAIGFDVVSGGQPVASGKGSVVYDSADHAADLDANGHAALTLADLPAGQHQVIVRYAGDATRNGAGAPFTLVVTDPNAAPASDAGDSDAAQDNPCPASARACVDLSTSTAWLQSGGQIGYGPVPITSGRPGYRTPTGTFAVYWKDKDHRSSLFNDAPMPNSVFFVGGVAFHEGSLSVASHGCIHLSWDASQAFWDGLSNGDGVYVFGYAPY